MREDAPVDSDQLVERFYILWSRIPLLLTGSESVYVRAAEGAVRLIQELDQTLTALEQDILSLRKGDFANYYRIHADLQRFTTDIHKITARTMLKDEEVAEAQREDIRNLYWELSGDFIAIIASAIVLVALLFKEFSKVNGLLRVAHAAEATVSAARAQSRAVIDAVPARIAARDLNGRYIFRNRYSVDRVPGIDPDGVAASSAEDELDRSVFETGQLIPLFEQEEVDREYGIHTWLTTKVPPEEAAGRITGVVTVSLDITQQKEAQKLNTLLATAVEHAGDVIEITDAESRFEDVNAAFERISGYSRADALGQTPFSLLMSDHEDEPDYRAVQNAIASGQVWHGTLTGRRKDGTPYEQEATISPVRDAEGVITHYVAVKRDITERCRPRRASGISPITTR